MPVKSFAGVSSSSLAANDNVPTRQIVLYRPLGALGLLLGDVLLRNPMLADAATGKRAKLATCALFAYAFSTPSMICTSL
jgi:hypothetical protein